MPSTIAAMAPSDVGADAVTGAAAPKNPTDCVTVGVRDDDRVSDVVMLGDVVVDGVSGALGLDVAVSESVDVADAESETVDDGVCEGVSDPLGDCVDEGVPEGDGVPGGVGVPDDVGVLV